MAQSANFEIWVANQGLDKVQVLDGRIFPIIAEIELDQDGQPATSKPHMLLFSPDYRFAYVANVGTGTVTIIDASSKKIVAQIPTGKGAHAPVPSPDGERVFVANPGDNTVTEIMTDTRRRSFNMGRTITTGTRPICLMFTADSQKAYVSLGGDPKAEDPTQTGGIEVIDVTRGEVIKRFPNTGKNGCGLIRSKDGQKMFANVGEPIDQWMVFDTKTDEMLHVSNTEVKDAHAMWLSSNGKELWIFGRQSNDVAIFDTVTYMKIGSVSVGERPDIADVSPGGKLLFIALRGQAVTGDPHAHSGSTPGVAVLDVASKKQIQTLALAGDPHGLAIRPVPAAGPPASLLLILLAVGLLVAWLVLRR
jgi:YVTN family beta-propeller protein